MRLQNVARAEDQNPTRKDRHFFACLRIATHAPPLLPNRKGSEPTDFNGFTLFQAGGDAIEHIFQQIG